MELRLTQDSATRMLDAWERLIQQDPLRRTNLEDGTIKLDSVPSPAVSVRGQVTEHAMDGSVFIAWYRASGQATQRAIDEARNATEVLGLPRGLHIGRLIDIKRGQDGTVYLKFRTITRSGRDGRPLYRTLNPSKGTLIELLINPTQAELARAMGSNNQGE